MNPGVPRPPEYRVRSDEVTASQLTGTGCKRFPASTQPAPRSLVRLRG